VEEREGSKAMGERKGKGEKKSPGETKRKRRRLEPELHSFYCAPDHGGKTAGLLSVVTLKRPIRQEPGSVWSPQTGGERGHFPPRWPALRNPSSVNGISIGIQTRP